MTRNLDYRIVDSPRDYWLVYKVINKKTERRMNKGLNLSFRL